MNNLALTAALATAPTSAFNELRERPRFWFPLLVLVLTGAGVVFWYYSAVDIDWLKGILFDNNPKYREMTEEQRAAAMSMMTGTTLRWASTVGVVFALPIFFLLQALYLLLAAKITKLPQGFKHWFSLICWCSLPTLLGTAVAAILMLLADNPQISPAVLQQLSLNELVFHVPPEGAGYSLLSSLSIPGFLCWALMIIGVRTWSQRSWMFSSVLVLLPIVLIYGCWAIFAFR
jgi:hypothetical protein